MSGEERKTTKPRYRRTRKLIRLDLQLKVVFITLFVTSLVLLINFQLNLAGLWSLSSRFMDSTNTRALLDAFRAATIQKFVLSVGMAVPLAASVGVLYSFKFCGPIFRFKSYFAGLKSGRWDERCMLRRGDDLKDVCDAINEAIDVFRDQVRRNHALLQEVKSFLDANPQLDNQVAKDQLELIRAEILEEQESYELRFGDPSAQEEAAAAGEADTGATDESTPARAEADDETPAKAGVAEGAKEAQDAPALEKQS